MSFEVHELDDLDGFTSRFLTVTVSTDPFGDPYEVGNVLTVFAWGHPVVKILRPEVDDRRVDEAGYGSQAVTWWWIGLDLGPETNQTRHREVVENFLIETGMVTGEWEDDHEALARALGTEDEDLAFWKFTENIGEHEPDAFVDRVCSTVPYLEP